MSDKKPLPIFLFCVFITGVLSIAAINCVPQASAQVPVSFNGFTTQATRTTAEIRCNELGGEWSEYSPLDGGKVIRVDSIGADCNFPKQKVVKDRIYLKLEKPEVINFAFDHAGVVEYAVFGYTFNSWAQKDQAKKTMKALMNDIFPMTATKIKEGQYRLNNTDHHLRFINEFYRDTFYLGVVISREPWEDYSFK